MPRAALDAGRDTTAMVDRFVKQLRTHMTDAERVLWRQLRAHRLLGEKFRRQQPIGTYIADFVHFGARLIVEADGGQHNASPRDAERDAWFERQGFRVLRFWNHDILDRTEAVLEEILRNVAPPSSADRRLVDGPPATESSHLIALEAANLSTLPNTCFPSPLAGEGGAAAPGEGCKSPDTPRDLPHPPLPNPSPARGEGLCPAPSEDGGLIDRPPATDGNHSINEAANPSTWAGGQFHSCSGHLIALEAANPSTLPNTCLPSPLAGEGGATAPGKGCKSPDTPRDLPHPTLEKRRLAREGRFR